MTTVLHSRCWHATVMRLHLSLLRATFCLFSTAVDSHLPSSTVAHAGRLPQSLSSFLHPHRNTFVSPALPTVWASWIWCIVYNAEFGLNKRKYLTLCSFVDPCAGAVPSLAVKQEKKRKSRRYTLQRHSTQLSIMPDADTG